MLSNKVKNALTIDIDLYNSTYDVLIKTDEYVDFAAVETSLKNSINKQLDNGTDPAELRVLFTVDTQAIAYFNRLVTIHNAKESKTGKSGGGGGSKKQKTAKTAAKKAAKKAVKKKPSATIEEQSLAAGLAAFTANHNTNFAESKIDGKRKTASQTELAEIERIVVKSIRAIMNAPAVVTDAIAKAKPSKAKPSNGKAKTPKVHAGNRIAKALAKSE
tara:strand:+ start:390 stop:1040 length:651 start_codon:yes stop_codon:yes gene_type:complete